MTFFTTAKAKTNKNSKNYEDKQLHAIDFLNGKRIDEEHEIPNNKDPLNDAIENGEAFEGDIRLTEKQAGIIMNGTKQDLVSMRSAIRERHWPERDSKVYIPYTISSTYSTSEKANIARAIEDFEKNTCIR